ncbi:tyrosine-type recombinase/integrase [Haloarcula rubripromontorii]|uniref:Tyrosine-type recombinase/integrase n=1 Tax=Haloarcula rubripromontorii TaxID=1705562 RepID=A0A847TX37_9EURY|nr:site-specific integrase [Haloarcula rubripromontorii]NLV07823.1 tyrosine-type recombinase/integrase [Haloarcula rubripromontorii]
MRNEKGQYTSPEDKQISPEMEELLGLYLTSLQQQKTRTKKSTIETRGREVRYWLAFCESNDIDPLAATTDDVKGYIQVNTHLADTTIGSYYRSVQSFYSIIENDAAEDRLRLVNGHPCKDRHTINLKEDYDIHEDKAEYKLQHDLAAQDIDGVREGSSDILALKPQQVESLFDNVPGKTPGSKLRNEVAVRLNWYTGCRSVELSRLDIDNIDWDECSIDVQSAKLNVKEHSGLIRRDVYFPEEFRFQLKRWCKRVRHSFSSAAEPNSGKILVTTHNAEMQGPQINDVVKTAAENAGVQRPLRPADPGPDDEIKEWFVTTHRIRRSAISHWVNDCESLGLHQVRRIAGHARIEQTMDYVEDDDDQIAEDYRRAMSSK